MQFIVGYSIVGLCSAAFSIYAFRQRASYQPSLWIYAASFLVFFLFWPVSIVLSATYYIGRWAYIEDDETEESSVLPFDSGKRFHETNA